jgi:outer membrane lipoprotein carrier protein
VSARNAVILPTVLCQLALASPEASLATRQIEQRHRALRDLSAQFTQTYRSGALGRELTEHGQLQLKPPGMMRWEYRDPERKLFVADGEHFYFYVPSDNQVYVRRKAGGDQGLAFRLLAGDRDVFAHFAVDADPKPDAPSRLRLTPRAEDRDVENLWIEVDASFRITHLEILDPLGNLSRFRFERYRENEGLRDGLFRFSIPKGCEVIGEE